ncbi:hypothetical protein AVEN_62506-1 [Araneus ventricosus]|uniref:Uncharacterized protein n=1 Tax=Araneus ventricosus TaxID=182803 RepID=A0A4Y1ZUR9_ARAVE|nr:hypothetical protein AVEN_62506-1 [Araneus ventricosus]
MFLFIADVECLTTDDWVGTTLDLVAEVPRQLRDISCMFPFIVDEECLTTDYWVLTTLNLVAEVSRQLRDVVFNFINFQVVTEDIISHIPRHILHKTEEFILWNLNLLSVRSCNKSPDLR